MVDVIVYEDLQKSEDKRAIGTGQYCIGIDHAVARARGADAGSLGKSFFEYLCGFEVEMPDMRNAILGLNYTLNTITPVVSTGKSLNGVPVEFLKELWEQLNSHNSDLRKIDTITRFGNMDQLPDDLRAIVERRLNRES